MTCKPLLSAVHPFSPTSREFFFCYFCIYFFFFLRKKKEWKKTQLGRDSGRVPWPSVLIISQLLPIQMDRFQSQVKQFQLPLVRLESYSEGGWTLRSLHSRLTTPSSGLPKGQKMSAVIQFNTTASHGGGGLGDCNGLVVVENAGKLVGVVCQKVPLSTIIGAGV